MKNEEAGYPASKKTRGWSVRNYHRNSNDFHNHANRRKDDRRRQPLDRRGILRWDPQMSERRLGKDRRAGVAGMARGG